MISLWKLINWNHFNKVLLVHCGIGFLEILTSMNCFLKESGGVTRPRTGRTKEKV
jgi:hypothetical protein